MTEYCIFLDPDRPPSDGTFKTVWRDTYEAPHRKDHQARWDLKKAVGDWCTGTFGPHCPEDLSTRRWTMFANMSWRIHRAPDIILFKLRWCHPVSWMTPAKYTEERAEANRRAWDGIDDYQW